MECIDGTLSLRVGSGVFPGDGIACSMFGGVYALAIDVFQRQGNEIYTHVPWIGRAILQEEDESQRPRLCQASRSGIDISLTAYADDVKRTRRIYSLKHLYTSTTNNKALFEQAVETVGVASNKKKGTTVVRFIGKNLKNCYQSCLQ